MSTNSPCAVLIVGAGPVGLTMACELARYGVPFRIVEEKAERSTASKALAIFPRTLEVFELMGMVMRVEVRGQHLERISVSDGTKGLAELSFEELPSRYRHVVCLPQSETEAFLAERLGEFKREVEWGTTLAGFTAGESAVRATLRRSDGTTEILEVPWMIGCDGAHSAVRHGLGLEFEGEQYDQNFVLADVTMALRIDDTRAHLFFAEHGVLALFPFGRGRYRIIAEVEPDSWNSQTPEPDLEEIRHYVWQRSPITAPIVETHWSSRFRISARKVARFRQGRVFLCGDSAHIHSPVGGQGMNTGIQDSFNLAWKLAYVVNGSSPESLLESYNAEREPVARGVLHLTDRLTHVATMHNALLQRARNLLVPLVAGIGVLRHRLEERLAELTIAYRDSPIVSGRYGHLHGGDRMPDVEFVSEQGSPVRLYEILARERRPILLIVTGGDPDAAERMLEIPAWFANLVPSWAVVDKPTRNLSVPNIVDDLEALKEAAGTAQPGLLLVRPDAYLGFGAEDLEFEKLEEHLALAFPS